MDDPVYLAQTGEVMTSDQQSEWLRARTREAVERGCGHTRASLSDELGVLLLEGWLVRPESEGEPRFQLVTAP